MERRFNNIGLRHDSRELLKNIENIGEIKTGEISGHSIEIELLETATHSSYTYYDNKKNRDDDFKLLNELLYEKI
jgi:hypothetical protein